jgi:hypothetical protein
VAAGRAINPSLLLGFDAAEDSAGKALLVRHLDLVTAKGKHSAVPVLELLGRADDAALVARYTPVLEAFNRAMVLYPAQQFDAAAELFGDAARARRRRRGPAEPDVQRALPRAIAAAAGRRLGPCLRHETQVDWARRRQDHSQRRGGDR